MDQRSTIITCSGADCGVVLADCVDVRLLTRSDSRVVPVLLYRVWRRCTRMSRESFDDDVVLETKISQREDRSVCRLLDWCVGDGCGICFGLTASLSARQQLV